MRTDPRELLALRIFGRKSRIRDRIEPLLARKAGFSSRPSVGGICFGFVALGAALLAGSLAPRWIALAQSPKRPAFEVAVVKPKGSGARGACCRVQPGGMLSATAATLRNVIEWTYEVQDYQILGGPGWLDSERFDITAKPEHPVDASIDNRDYFRQMVQGLLEDLFKLTLRRETRDLPAYALTVAKGGPKLRPLQKPENPTESRIHVANGQLIAERVTMGLFAREVLSNVLGRVVIDKTGLTAYYDFKLERAPEVSIKAPDGDSETNADRTGPSLFTAIQDQLGFKLESQKAPVEILVVEHAEKPDAN